MLWFRKKLRKHPKKMHVPELHFLDEQDGLPERGLKNRLIEFFHRDRSVKAAYLARVAYAKDTMPNVALCLRTEFGADVGLAEKVGKIFAVQFNAAEHMDIIFLNEEQEAELVKVCAPFFKK